MPPPKLTTSTGRLSPSEPALQNIPLPVISTPRKSRRFTRDQIKQYCYMMAYGRSVGPTARAVGYAVHTCIDEVHTIVTRDDYNAADGVIRDIYDQVAKHINGDSPVRLGYPLAPVSACGGCPRSLGCLRGRPPAIICPRCRRTNHSHSAVLDATYRAKRGDYELVHNYGNHTVEKHDYVPTSCPLWRESAPMVAKEPCPICKEKRQVTAVRVKEPTANHPRHCRLLFRFRRSQPVPSKNPLFDYLRRQHTKKGKHAKNLQQAHRRPAGCAVQRTMHQRQPQHRLR